MKNPVLSICLAIVFFVPWVCAQDNITARAGDLPLDSPYVVVNLDRLANDSQAVTFPSDRVQLWSIPFQVARKGSANNLFLKPIGWSAAKDESHEYPGYIAKYDTRWETTNDASRAMVQVPVADYAALWMLAAADNDTNLGNTVTFRLGVAEGQARVVYHDFTATIPHAGEKQAGSNVSKIIPTAAGNLYLVRVPIAKAIAQDFKERTFLDLDITKELRVQINLPDPNRFELRPLGPPCGVRIYALTLERAPIAMEVTGDEAGNVFNEPQLPTFRLDLRNVRNDHGRKYSIQAVAQRDDGIVTTNTISDAFTVWAWAYSNPTTKQIITVPVQGRGQYRLRISLLSGGQAVTTRETTFALLAPDTRKYRSEAPFGTWDFGGGHVTPNDPDLLGPLYVKAGLRYGMASSFLPESARRKYGVLNGSDLRVRGTNEIQYVLQEMANDPALPAPTRFLTFHESAISGDHLTRTPDMFTGRPPYVMSAEEQKSFSNLWAEAENSFRAAHEQFPQAEIYFGNTVPHLLEEFLRHKFPRPMLDKVGNESGSFMRMPEAQPLDFVSNNAGIWMLREMLDHYGYKEVELRQCLEICYPDSNPGNLAELTQAAYLVRHIMHSLAWGIPVLRPFCLSDMGNSYYYSNWGASGLMHAWPNVSPKPAYVAYATLTQVLDGAKFTRAVPTQSRVVYAFEFRNKDKDYVTCLWTPNGQRSLTVEVPGAKKEKLTNLLGRETEIEFKDHKAQIEISNAPVYLATDKPIRSISPGAAALEGIPTGKTVVISSLDKLEDWTVERGRSEELEVYNFMCPRRKGDFTYRTDPSVEGGKNILEVKPRLPVEGSVYLPMYSVLSLNKPVEIPGEPTEIGVMVNGNGGWGRVIFELEDASGQRWISIGAEQPGAPMKWMESWIGAEAFKKLNPKTMNVSDWNSDDAWGRSSIDFEGWGFVKFPLPGQYPGEGYHWPMNSQWRGSGDGVVKYPLRFKKLILTIPEKVLYGTEYAPVTRQEIQLKDLVVTYEPAEKVFATAR